MNSFKDTMYVGLIGTTIGLTIKREEIGWVARDAEDNIVDAPQQYRIDLFQKLEEYTLYRIYELRKA